jgi:hypothetical protein
VAVGSMVGPDAAGSGAAARVPPAWWAQLLGRPSKQTHAAVPDTLTAELQVKRLVCPLLEAVSFIGRLGSGVRRRL